ncbi:hypothetical protein EYF80_019516 [Liparis tanakae]|uniref:Uncharacterized protein n=1 Tax=Liparis tanakae TaxID=230148 RepID=A0A4Z2HZC6_9TELE|nr:hypothetical protein EYF80_019516 [Liparis tanakae]
MAKTALQLASPSSLVATHVYKPASLMRQSRIHSPPESWPSDGSSGSSLWYHVSEGLGYPVTDTLSRMSQLVPTAALRSLRLKTGGAGSCIAASASEKMWSCVTLGPSRLRLDPGPSAISISTKGIPLDIPAESDLSCDNLEQCRLPKPNARMFQKDYSDASFIQVAYECRVKPAENGKVEIVTAKFGRFDQTTCTKTPLDMTFSGSFHAQKRVEKKCNGLGSCSVTASTEDLGPTVPSYDNNYLIVDYIFLAVTPCLASEAPGQMIKVMTIHSGLESDADCSDRTKPATAFTGDSHPGLMYLFKFLCNYLEHCLLPNVTMFQQDVSDNHFIQIDYQCHAKQEKNGASFLFR